jgi:predicted RNA-binding protein with PIN domain
VPEPTLYLFDGYNVLNAGAFRAPDDLVDRLASFVALRGAKGVVVFDGVGDDSERGPLAIRYSASADDLLERLAAENRGGERVCLVSSDEAVRRTAGQEVRVVASKRFVAELDEQAPARVEARNRSLVEDALDDVTRARLERWRRRRP